MAIASLVAFLPPRDLWLAFGGLALFGGGGAISLWEAFSDTYYARLYPESTFAVSFDEQCVCVAQPAGPPTAIAWSDLERVAIQTTSTGPARCDYIVHLSSRADHLAVPLGAQGFDALMARLAELPGFDHEAAGAATLSTEDAMFACWRRGAV